MQMILGGIDATLGVLRTAFFAVAAVLAVVCALDWMARTRRLGPFGPVARFLRNNVDPLIAPVERRVVRAGGLPSSAPWWALIAVVLSGILVMALLEFVRGEIGRLLFAFEDGPGGIYRLVVSWGIGILQVALVVRVVLSWVSVGAGSWYARWSQALTEPLLRPLRRIIPAVGMMDITPIVAWFLLMVVKSLLLRI